MKHPAEELFITIRITIFLCMFVYAVASRKRCIFLHFEKNTHLYVCILANNNNHYDHTFLATSFMLP